MTLGYEEVYPGSIALGTGGYKLLSSTTVAADFDMR